MLVRLRSDRVLYGEPGPYSGRGRPRRHGKVFRFKDEKTWPALGEYVSFSDERYGQVELHLWRPVSVGRTWSRWRNGRFI